MVVLTDNTWEKIRKGDLKSLEKLYKKLYPRLCYYAYKILGDKFISEEIVQDAFLKIWQSRDSIFIKESVSKYLFTITHNLAINAAIHKGTFKNTVNQKASEAIWQKIQNTFEVDDFLIEKLEADETEKKINSLINKLPQHCKTVFLLSRYENKSNKEIAQILKISEHTVRTQIYRAIEKIIKGLEK